MAEINDLNVTDASNTTRFPEGMAPSAVNNSARALEGIVARWHKDINGSVAVSGTDTYTATINADTGFSLYDGYMFCGDFANANTGAATLNLTPDGGSALGAVAIKKHVGTALAAGDIAAGAKVVLRYDGTNFQMLSPPATETGTGSLNNIVDDTTPQLGGDLDLNGNAIDFPSTANISDVLDEDNMASDSATALATQQSIKAYVDGAIRWTNGTAQATTSGTAINFTGIPSTASVISVLFSQVSLSGTDDFLVQIGDSGGLETSGYASVTTEGAGQDATSTAGFIIEGGAAARSITGVMVLRNLDGNTWISTHTVYEDNGGQAIDGAGRKTLSATLDRLTITTPGGSNTFDAGTINIQYQ